MPEGKRPFSNLPTTYQQPANRKASTCKQKPNIYNTRVARDKTKATTIC